MTPDLDVCNRALSLVGTRSTVADINEDTAESRACLKWYQNVVDQCLRAAHWGFASRPVTLSLLKALPGTFENPTAGGSVWSPDWPAPPWYYSYAYPADCIMMWYVQAQTSNYGGSSVPIFPSGTVGFVNNYPKAPFVIGNDMDGQGNDIRVVLTNASRALATYTRRVENTLVWDPLFDDAVTSALAGAMTVDLIGNAQLAASYNQQANARIMSARASDANEGLTVIDMPVDWIDARSGYARSYATTFTAAYGPLFGAG